MYIKTSSTHFVRRPDDIIVYRHRADWDKSETVEVAEENVAAMNSLLNGRPTAFLVHVPNTYMSREVLNVYRKDMKKYQAFALIVNSFGAKVISNLFLRIISGKESTPIKIFTKEEAAIAWLHGELQSEDSTIG